MSTSNVRTQIERTQQEEHSSPLYLTSSFVFESAEHMRALFAEEIEGNIYSRFTNPNTTEFVEKLRILEGSEAGIACASGMAAGFASIMGLLKSGDHIVASRAVFGSTHTLLTQYLPRWGITYTYVDIADNEQWAQAVGPSTKMFLVETPSNPGLAIADLEFLGALAQERNIILNVDNTFATPLLQKPIEYGAHLVWHSATKWIDGQGRVLGGAVLGRADLIREIYLFARNTGPSLSAFNAWILSKSMETLQVRLEKHCSNALAVAKALVDHANLERLDYPHLPSHPQYALARKQMKLGGGIITLNLRNGADGARRFVDGLSLASITANLGDTRTIATHPATSTHARLTEEARLQVGITQGLVRMSIGLESVEEIIADIQKALDNA